LLKQKRTPPLKDSIASIASEFGKKANAGAPSRSTRVLVGGSEEKTSLGGLQGNDSLVESSSGGGPQAPAKGPDQDQLTCLGVHTPALSDATRKLSAHLVGGAKSGDKDGDQIEQMDWTTGQPGPRLKTSGLVSSPSDVRQKDSKAIADQCGQETAPKASTNAVQPLKDVFLQFGANWVLAVLCMAYLHGAAAGFSIPAMLPEISPALNLSDSQGAFLTSGYTVLHALALVPVGFMADCVNRPQLLAGGLAAWSALTSLSSQAHSFTDLLLLRIGFASAQATQNPVCFNLIPEIFPKNKSTALAIYNCAVYIGRAMSFTLVFLLGKLGISGEAGIKMIPVDALDPSRNEILYTVGSMAAVVPLFDYNFQMFLGESECSCWRDILFWLGLPGMVIAAMILLTINEPRNPQNSSDVDKALKSIPSASADGFNSQLTTDDLCSEDDIKPVQENSARLGIATATNSNQEGSHNICGIVDVMKRPAFQILTLGAAMNDIGSWSLIAWHSTFYERVYDLRPEVYAPLLAAVIPIGGILGGVGGGLLADRLSENGQRFWLTFGATALAAPFLLGSFNAPDYWHSFHFLLFGFALSEAWRSPVTVMVRETAPSKLASAATAVNMCIRYLIAGLGPPTIALLSDKFDLQKAMGLIPISYLLSGIIFLAAERVIAAAHETRNEGQAL